MPTSFPRRRCRLCKGWFRPNARVGDKQYACTKPECQLVRQIRNEEARLVRDPAYFRARVAKPRPEEPPKPVRERPERTGVTYEEVRDRVTHKAIMLQLPLESRLRQEVADHDVHKVITAQLAIVVGLITELARHDVHKQIELDLVALHDRGRRLLARGDHDGKAKPG